MYTYIYHNLLKQWDNAGRKVMMYVETARWNCAVDYCFAIFPMTTRVPDIETAFTDIYLPRSDTAVHDRILQMFRGGRMLRFSAGSNYRYFGVDQFFRFVSRNLSRKVPYTSLWVIFGIARRFSHSAPVYIYIYARASSQGQSARSREENSRENPCVLGNCKILISSYWIDTRSNVHEAFRLYRLRWIDFLPRHATPCATPIALRQINPPRNSFTRTPATAHVRAFTRVTF